MSAKPFYTSDGDASQATGSLQSLLGEEAFAKLSEKLGGTRVYVPATLGEHHPLAVIMGLEAAQQLAANFAGTTLTIPITPARRQRIIELDAEGWTRARIARAVRLTERRIYQILEESRAASARPRQPTLL